MPVWFADELQALIASPSNGSASDLDKLAAALPSDRYVTENEAVGLLITAGLWSPQSEDRTLRGHIMSACIYGLLESRADGSVRRAWNPPGRSGPYVWRNAVPQAVKQTSFLVRVARAVKGTLVPSSKE